MAERVDFSIVVPVYNVEAYLDECLRSLQSQSGASFEVVCVDDGSTDGSRAILDAWAARWPAVRIVSQPNGGLSAARNSGLAVAQGEYVLFVDSDDTLAPDALRTLASAVQGEDMICFACRRTDSGLADVLAPERSSGAQYYECHALEPRVVPFVCVWQRCYRRAFLEEAGMRFREGVLHEDNHFTPLACQAARTVRVLPQVLYNYRVRQGSIMTTRGLASMQSLVLIANELAPVAERSGWVMMRAVAQYYQAAFAASSRATDCRLQRLVDWQAYRRVASTKMRHRLNYVMARLCPPLLRAGMQAASNAL